MILRGKDTDRPLKKSLKVILLLQEQPIICLNVLWGYLLQVADEYWALSLATYNGLVIVFTSAHEKEDAMSILVVFLLSILLVLL